MSFYVDCACPDHDIWLSFDSEETAAAYYEARSCKAKLIYRDRVESDPPFPKFVTIKESATEERNG